MNRLLLAMTAALIMGGSIVACSPEPRIIAGKADYMALCAGCHGISGEGNGPAAAGLEPPPADLTRIAAGNGGSFPGNQVMGRIHGYTMGGSESPMPAFGDLLEGKAVPYDMGNGARTPTAWRLVALTEYLERMQK